MLINFDAITKKVNWYNLLISETMAQQCLSPYTIWLEGEGLPQIDDVPIGQQAVLVYDEVTNSLTYTFEPEPEAIYTDTQLIMQALSDLELTLLEGGI